MQTPSADVPYRGTPRFTITLSLTEAENSSLERYRAVMSQSQTPALRRASATRATMVKSLLLDVIQSRLLARAFQVRPATPAVAKGKGKVPAPAARPAVIVRGPRAEGLARAAVGRLELDKLKAAGKRAAAKRAKRAAKRKGGGK